MSRFTLTAIRDLILAMLATVLVIACSDAGKNDPIIRGERTHQVCLSCHGTDLYVSSKRKIKTLDALRKEVDRWGDYYNPAFSEQDVDDVTAYLNAKFYQF